MKKKTVTEQFNQICSYQGNNFTEHFGSMPFAPSKTKLELKKLPHSMNDSEILAELKPSSVTLGEVYHFLEKADKSEWYIFYCRDANNILWAVDAHWSGDGWGVNADSVEFRSRWNADSCVCSRRFSDTLNPDPVSLAPFVLSAIEVRIGKKIYKLVEKE